MCPDRWPFNDRNSVSIDERHKETSLRGHNRWWNTRTRALLPLLPSTHAWFAVPDTPRVEFIHTYIYLYIYLHDGTRDTRAYTAAYTGRARVRWYLYGTLSGPWEWSGYRDRSGTSAATSVDSRESGRDTQPINRSTDPSGNTYRCI